MKHLLLAIALSVALLGCSEDNTKSGKQAAADLVAGQTLAERECKGCHGLDGKGAAPGIPNLAGQSERYLFVSLMEYKERKRMHAALREIAEQMTDADSRNVAGYYASLTPIPASPGKIFSPYEHGKVLAESCADCHGQDGNSKMPGTPSLAGQQPRYFAVAVQEYLSRMREVDPMHSLLRELRGLDVESLALYFASQAPAQRPAPPFGDPAAGEPLTAVCGGCHGSHGVSTDAATPSLASQDAQYLLNAIKAYGKTRHHDSMRRSTVGLTDKDIDNIVAFYVVQKSKAAESGQTLVQELTEKCDRCHSAERDNPAMAVPKIHGQDKDYLVMALRAYRDDKRESSVMHKMSLPYSDAVIESISSFYASQPTK
jgi:cytochrome c553